MTGLLAHVVGINGRSRHDELTGYEEAFSALSIQYGPFPRGSLIELEAARLATLWQQILVVSNIAHETSVAREGGTGRRPSRRDVLYTLKRQGVVNVFYERSLERFEKMVGRLKMVEARSTQDIAGEGWASAREALRVVRTQTMEASNGTE